MKPLYTKQLAFTEDGYDLSDSFRKAIEEWMENNNASEYNPIELHYVMRNELDHVLCRDFCDRAVELQTDVELSKDVVLEQLSSAVEEVLKDNDSECGLYWPDIIKKCQRAFEAKKSFDARDY
jgi:hypothetical protein